MADKTYQERLAEAFAEANSVAADRKAAADAKRAVLEEQHQRDLTTLAIAKEVVADVFRETKAQNERNVELWVDKATPSGSREFRIRITLAPDDVREWVLDFEVGKLANQGGLPFVRVNETKSRGGGHVSGGVQLGEINRAWVEDRVLGMFDGSFRR